MTRHGHYSDRTIGIIRAIVALTFFVSLSACIAIPVAPPSQEHPFKRELLSFVVVGETTRDDVQANLAEGPSPLTPVTYEHDSVWIYSADRDTVAWLVCVGAGYMADCAVGRMGTRDYYLAFRFDDDGTVADWGVSNTLYFDCTSTGVCEDGGQQMVFAATSRDLSAKEFRAAENQCSIYLFATLPRDAAPGAMTAWLDEVPVGWLVNDSGYFLLSVEPGPHTVATRYLFKQLRQSVNLECERAQLFFVHLDVKHQGKADMELMLEPESAGRKHIQKRSLVLRPDKVW